MSQLKLVVCILCLSLVVLAIPCGVNADAWNKKTTVSFDQPVEVPGVGAQILPAGTYVFKIMDSLTDRNIVQIFDKSQTHVFTTILAIPNYRIRATDKTVMTFRERAAGSPEAIRAWFYPGNNWGQEFVYPKKRAIELAKITHEPVLAMEFEPVQPADEATVVALKEAPVTAVKPTGEEVEVTEVVERPPVQTAAVVTPTPDRPMPKTASPLPLLELMGLLSLGVGGVLSVIRKRSA